MTTTPSTLRKRSLAEELAERMQTQIGEGRFRTGEKLPSEPELMRLFGVGRSTVREAVRILSDLGFLQVRQGAGTFVVREDASSLVEQRMKRADIRELDEVRGILEAAIAGKAAERHTDRDAQQIRKHLADRKAAAETNRLEQCIDADANFHEAIAQATHNAILAELYRATALHLREGFRRIYSDTGYLLASHPLHEQLARHILRGDVSNASRTICDILEKP